MNALECYKGWSELSGNREGRCCCNCRWQRPISGHPWNRVHLVRTPIDQVIGWGCTVPDMPNITFFESEHGVCEMHEWKEVT